MEAIFEIAIRTKAFPQVVLSHAEGTRADVVADRLEDRLWGHLLEDAWGAAFEAT